MKKPIPYDKVKIITQKGIKFADPVFNEFISEEGGIVPGNMIALAGTSGAGKTTLCKKLQKELPKDMISVFYSLETGKGSVAKQTKRVKTGDNALVCDENTFPTWSAFMDYLHEDKPMMATIDSLQHAAKLLSKENGKYKYDNYATIIDDLYAWKEKHGTIVILIVQLNSDGKIEGPAGTIFDVDAPLKLVADPKTEERHLEALKNRMGGKVGKIMYEFVNDDSVIKFYTQDEWNVIKKGASIANMAQKAIEAYTQAYKNHDNYKEFKKELVKRYKKVYDANPEDGVTIVTKTIFIIDELSKKYFYK